MEVFLFYSPRCKFSKELLDETVIPKTFKVINVDKILEDPEIEIVIQTFRITSVPILAVVYDDNTVDLVVGNVNVKKAVDQLIQQSEKFLPSKSSTHRKVLPSNVTEKEGKTSAAVSEDDILKKNVNPSFLWATDITDGFATTNFKGTKNEDTGGDLDLKLKKLEAQRNQLEQFTKQRDERLLEQRLNTRQ